MTASFMPELPAEGIYAIEGAECALTPFFLNSPHSGDCFPPSFLGRSQLPLESLRRASDLFVDDLLAPAPGTLGVPVMRALLPRSFLDLNREPFELDPRLIAGPLPVDANTRSLRVAGGLGTVPRVIGDQIEIYSGKITLEEALGRIEYVYVPYHMRLHRELAMRHARHSRVVLIDVHSMPSLASPRPARPMADLVLGDRFGASCAPGLIDEAERIARQLGFRVERNQPYAGGYITEHYGRPMLGWHALQIEISRALYMDEARLVPNAGFAPLSEALMRLIAALCDFEAFEIRNSPLQFSQKAAE